jgi:hypothetical protein
MYLPDTKGSPGICLGTVDLTLTSLTQADMRAGLYGHPERIGTLMGWQATLMAANADIQGHRLRPAVRESNASPEGSPFSITN